MAFSTTLHLICKSEDLILLTAAELHLLTSITRRTRRIRKSPGAKAVWLPDIALAKSGRTRRRVHAVASTLIFPRFRRPLSCCLPIIFNFEHERRAAAQR
jgi:hypothetical protein